MTKHLVKQRQLFIDNVVKNTVVFGYRSAEKPEGVATLLIGNAITPNDLAACFDTLCSDDVLHRIETQSSTINLLTLQRAFGLDVDLITKRWINAIDNAHQSWLITCVLQARDIGGQVIYPVEELETTACKFNQMSGKVHRIMADFVGQVEDEGAHSNLLIWIAQPILKHAPPIDFEAIIEKAVQ